MEKAIHTFIILAYKESIYLEDCIKSVMKQKYKSNVVIATTTDNQYIRYFAQKYNLQVIVGKHTNIGGDFDFALNLVDTELVTIAHQDDIYHYEYSSKVVEYYEKYRDSSIIFTDYYEIRNSEKIENNINLRIKRIILSKLKNIENNDSASIKKWAIKFGNSISCPAVTFVKKNCPSKIFESDYESNVDWLAWTRLSERDGRFTYISQMLMGHRISTKSTTTDIVNRGIRTKEDFEMYCMFWPKFIAKIFTQIYRLSEKSNNIKD